MVHDRTSMAFRPKRSVKEQLTSNKSSIDEWAVRIFFLNYFNVFFALIAYCFVEANMWMWLKSRIFMCGREMLCMKVG